MREGIFDYVNGQKYINFSKVIGTGYGNGWFSNCPVRYRLFAGARNTKKSKDILGYEPIMKILSNDKRNVVICRKNDCDNRQSTYENITGCVYDLGLQDRFVFHTNPLEIIYKPTKQKIVFRGLNNPTSLNSITFAHGYLTDVYIEEAFEVDNFSDFRKLDGSLRGKLPDGLFLQITLCFNAWDGECWQYEEFFKGNLEDDYEYLDRDDVTYMDYYNPNWVGPYGKGLYLHKSTYKINEFRDKEVYDLSAQRMKEKAPEIYKVEFLGMFGVTTGKVYDCWNEKLIKPIQNLINLDYADFAIGCDSGLSDGQGNVLKVKKGEDPNVKIKAATTMTLCAITSDMGKLVCLEEYFHSNSKTGNAYNTDNKENYTEPQQIDACARQIYEWIEKYRTSNNILMKGQINIYVDSADIGFRQALEIKLREYGIYNCNCYASTKKTIRTRVSFENLLMAYEDLLVAEGCKNLIREFKNARKGEKGEARKPGNDHTNDAFDYAVTPFFSMISRWKEFKER